MVRHMASAVPEERSLQTLLWSSRSPVAAESGWDEGLVYQLPRLLAATIVCGGWGWEVPRLSELPRMELIKILGAWARMSVTTLARGFRTLNVARKHQRHSLRCMVCEFDLKQSSCSHPANCFRRQGPQEDGVVRACQAGFLGLDIT